MKLFSEDSIKIRSYCLKMTIISFLLVGFVFLVQDGQAQEMTVTGTVLYNPKMNDCLKETPCRDAIKLTQKKDWEPPQGAVNIAVKGTDKVVKANRRGNYKVTVPSPDASLMFMYIGYTRIEVPVNGRNTVDIKLTPTPLPIVDRLLDYIMPRINAGQRPDIEKIAEEAEVNRETARDMMWLLLGTRPFAEAYPNEYIPDYSFE